MSHSIIPPSNAKVWRVCTAQPLASAAVPNVDTESTIEGTAVHEIGSKFIELASRALPYPARDSVVGSSASNGVIFDDDMYEGAEMYADYVAKIMRERGNFTPNIEQRLEMPDIHAMNWGTCDCWFFTPSTATIDVFELKYGFLPVEVFENDQLIEYANGIAKKLNINGVYDQQVKVVFHIIQPRARHRDGSIRTWKVLLSTLRGYFNRLSNAAHEVFSGDAKFVSGEHCLYCPIRHTCKAAEHTALLSVEYSEKYQPEELTPDAIGVELAILRKAKIAIDARLTGLEAQAEALLRSGVRVKNFTLEPSYGNVTWTSPAQQVITMGELFGIDLRNPKPITPTQAVSKGMNEELVKSMSEKPQRGLKLAFDDGTRARYLFTSEN